MLNFPLLTELIEIEAQTDFFAAAPLSVTTIAKIQVEQTPIYTALLVQNLGELAFYNTILGLGLRQPVTEADLDSLLKIYQEAGLSFSIRLSPQAKPENLPAWLEKRNISPEAGNFSAKLYHTLENLAPVSSDFEIQAVTKANAADFLKIACNGISEKLELWLDATLERPNWQHFLACKQGEPTASGSLFISNNAGWIGWAATAPRFRRMGAQSALLAYRLQIAARNGCKLVCSDTGKPTLEKPNSSYNNMLRAGFKLSHIRQKYTYNLT